MENPSLSSGTSTCALAGPPWGGLTHLCNVGRVSVAVGLVGPASDWLKLKSRSSPSFHVASLVGFIGEVKIGWKVIIITTTPTTTTSPAGVNYMHTW